MDNKKVQKKKKKPQNTEDWRLFREQERYLTGAHLIYHLYEPHNPSNDHDHCEFCMAKFGKGDADLKIGYSTLNNEIWICPKCYKDFKDRFGWKLE